MARNKTIEIDIKETSKNKGDVVDLELVAKKKVIGTIHQESPDQKVSILMASGKKRTAQTIDEAIEAVIAEYNLHDL